MFRTALVVMLAAVWAAGPLHTALAARHGGLDGARWMEQSMAQLADRTLPQLTLPGTHDSGSYNMTDTLIGPPPFLDVIIKVADKLGLPVGKIIDGWSRSQDRNFYGQFSGGIRYVDVRAVWYNVTSEWHTHHGVVLGNPLAFLLNDTAAFLRDNPGEVVVLEVSHLNADEATHELLAQEIEHYLGPYLYPRAPAFTETLADMVRLHHRAMVTIEDDAVLAKHPLLWPGETIINSYANSDNLTTMEAYNVEKVDEFLQHNRTYPGQLFKMSWTLTPNEDTVLRMLLPDHPKTLIELADTASKALAPWAAAQATAHNHLYPLLGNILIIDHFETSDIPSVVAPPQALQ